MNERLYDDNKMKVLILYLLNELDTKLDFETISEIAVWDGTINYFVFTDCFHQLVQAGAIEKEADDKGEPLFSISPLGKQNLVEVEDTLLRYVKDKIMRSATRLIAFKKNGSVVSSRIEPHGDGFYLISAIRNPKFDLLELKLYFDNKEEAEIMKDGFDKRAEKIYSGILALYSGDMRFFD